MAGAIMNKVWNLLGVETDDYDVEYSEYDMPEVATEETTVVEEVSAEATTDTIVVTEVETETEKVEE